MSYAVKEVFYTLQGEGANAGRPAVFCRFAGCNLWSGREADRALAVCKFCDTDFVGTDGADGGRFDSADALAARIASLWPARAGRRFTVLTGGEPALQLDGALVAALHARGFEVAIETNGTLELAPGIDWVCVSPKAGTEVRVRSGNELKLVFPQEGAPPEQFEGWGFEHFLLQPMDGAAKRENTERAIAYCMRHPRWKLSLQTHKLIGIR
jgi:7-carboxy-7-deazaguanine synthase